MRNLNFYSIYIFEYKFNKDTLDDKVNCVINYYNKKYIMDDIVQYGAEFDRAYKEAVSNNN